MIISFELIENRNITDKHKEIFIELLKRQNKVTGEIHKKIEKCLLLCIVRCNEIPIAMGAIKQKTKSVFGSLKANKPELENKIEYELGYLYTSESHNGKGIANQVVKLLLSEFKYSNLMATTESSENPGMVKILLRNGFVLEGNQFQSVIHKNKLSLFIKYKVKAESHSVLTIQTHYK